jgi:hypothetical protein
MEIGAIGLRETLVGLALDQERGAYDAENPLAWASSERSESAQPRAGAERLRVLLVAFLARRRGPIL